MGCCASNRQQIEYSKYETMDSDLSGPIINPKINNFEEDVVSKYKNKSYIEDFLKNAENFKEKEAIGYRIPKIEEIKEKLDDGSEKTTQTITYDDKYTFLNYETFAQLIETVSKNIEYHNLTPVHNVKDEGQYKMLGFFARDMVEYVITDFACQLNNVSAVTIYATLGEEAFKYICEQTLIETICISPDSNVEMLIKYKKLFGLTFLKNVILFDFTQPILNNGLERLQNAGFNVIKFTDLMKIEEKAVNITLNRAVSDSVYAICYTSGTTGQPKGVKILQRGMCAIMTIFDDTGCEFREETILFYLPLAHSMERANVLHCLFKGGRLGCISGDVKSTLKSDIAILKPTIIIAVPRIWNLFRDGIFSQFNQQTGMKKSLIDKAIEIKRENYRNEGTLTHWLYDKLVFKKVREAFGGNLKFILTGSAPLTTEVAEDLKIVLGVPIIEGYGMTETCAGLTVTSFYDLSNNSVGGVLTNSRVKLVDVPEMNYNSKTKLDDEDSPTGEICISGPLVFAGYFRNPEATKETIIDGWVHTGDIGRLLPGNRALKIIDRKKEIFKLSQAEYIAPTKLENIYKYSQYVNQICIYGDSTRDKIVAIIVVNKISLLKFLKSKNKVGATAVIQDVDAFIDAKDMEVLDEIKRDLAELNKSYKLNPLERVDLMILTKDEFSGDMLTPTMKMVRKKIQGCFQNQIDEVYRSK
jgi:long-chain acyl-CoA synthetase